MERLLKKKTKTHESRIEHAFRLIHYLRGIRLYMIFNCLVGLIFKLIPIAIAFVSSYMVGLLLANRFESASSILMVVIGLVLGHAVFNYGDLWFSHDIAYKILIKIRQSIYEHLEKCIPSFQKQMSSVEMASIATQDVENLEWFYAHTVNTAVISLIIALAVIVALFSIHFLFGIVLVLAIIMIYLIPFFFRKTSAEHGKTLRAAHGALESEIGEGIQGMREIIGFAWNESFIHHYQEKEKTYIEASICDAKRRGKESLIIEMIKGLVSIMLLLISAYLVESGQLSPLWVPSTLVLSMLVFGPLNNFMGMTQQFSTIFASAERTISLLEFPMIKISEGERPLADKIEKIEFENVSYRYPNSNKDVLKNVSFTLYGGEFVSLAGVSGSGKTTIVNLLQRYIEPTSGVIRLNGFDIREYDLDSWKQLYAIVRQDSYLFNLNIAENIRMNKLNASSEEVETAATKAQAHFFINHTKDGYDTMIGEKGSRLSGGEKQRIALARALIKESNLLILDEATANIDNKTERNLWQALRKRDGDQLILSIAHRTTAMDYADRVIFLNQGRIEATGTYQDLCKTNQLFKKQVLGLGYEENEKSSQDKSTL